MASTSTLLTSRVTAQIADGRARDLDRHHVCAEAGHRDGERPAACVQVGDVHPLLELKPLDDRLDELFRLRRVHLEKRRRSREEARIAELLLPHALSFEGFDLLDLPSAPGSAKTRTTEEAFSASCRVFATAVRGNALGGVQSATSVFPVRRLERTPTR